MFPGVCQRHRVNQRVGPRAILAKYANLDIAREAFDQASKRLADMLDTKKAFEQKAFTLFSGYLTLSIALFGVAATLYKDHGLSFTVVSVVIVELTLIAGAVCFVFALMDEKYGAVASDPNMWLNKGTIDGDETVLPRMLAYVPRWPLQNPPPVAGQNPPVAGQDGLSVTRTGTP